MTQLKQRYRLAQMNLIPKFGNGSAAKDQFGSAGMAAVSQRGGAAGAPKADVISAKAVGQGGVTAGAAAATTVAKPGGAARLWKTVASVGALFSLRSEPRGVRLAPMSGRRLVQPELRLDAVKPVRNDLADCDFEVREIRLAAKAPVARETGLLATAGSVVDRARNLIR